MAPRIAQKAKNELHGVIMMAGPARPLDNIILEQIQYLDSISPDKQREDLLKTTTRQVHYLHSPAFNKSSPTDSLPLHLKASYWLSIEAYQPLKIIKSIPTPFFILQGGKDYQVRMTDFNLWKKATRGKSNMTYKNYPGLTHLFMESKGVPSPDDYKHQSHIPDYVINDIAQWIKMHD